MVFGIGLLLSASLADNVIHFCPGEQIVLKCGYNNTEENVLSVIWYVENEAVSSYTARTKRLVDVNETMFQIQNETYSLKVLGMSKSNKYKCRVLGTRNNENIIEWSTYHYNKPYFKSGGNICSIDGVPIRLTCSVSNLTQEADANIHWTLEDDNIEKSVMKTYEAGVLTSTFMVDEENAKFIFGNRGVRCTMVGKCHSESVEFKSPKGCWEDSTSSGTFLKFDILVFMLFDLFFTLFFCLI